MARKGVRLAIGMTEFAQKLEDAVGEHSVQEFADKHGLPYWVVRDLLKGKAQSPRIEHAPAFAEALGMNLKDFVDLFVSVAPQEAATT